MNQLINLVVPLSLLISNAAALDAESIIGGKLAGETQFPYQVSLQLGGSNVCGGSLIAPDLVLTAAHCVTFNGRVPRAPYSILAGATYTKDGTGKRIDVAKIYAHSKFGELSDSSVVNDIAVLKLVEKFNVKDSASIGLVDLPKDEDSFTGKIAVISGFGWDQISMKMNYLSKSMKRTGSSEQKLKFAPVKILSNSECRDRISSHICGRIVTPANSQKRGVCTGDSGGPLVHENKVIGIVSYGLAACDESLRPTTYTRVTSFLDFIDGAVKDEPTADTRVTVIRYTAKDKQGAKASVTGDYDRNELSSILEAIKARWEAILAKGREN